MKMTAVLAATAISLIASTAMAQTAGLNFDGVYAGHMVSASGTCGMASQELRFLVQNNVASWWSTKQNATYEGHVGANGEAWLVSPSGLKMSLKINGQMAHTSYDNGGCQQESDFQRLQ